MGSSRDLAVGTVAVASLLTASMLGNQINANENPTLYLHLAFTATFFAGVFQATLGIVRLDIYICYVPFFIYYLALIMKNTHTIPIPNLIHSR